MTNGPISRAPIDRARCKLASVVDLHAANGRIWLGRKGDGNGLIVDQVDCLAGVCSGSTAQPLGFVLQGSNDHLPTLLSHERTHCWAQTSFAMRGDGITIGQYLHRAIVAERAQHRCNAWVLEMAIGKSRLLELLYNRRRIQAQRRKLCRQDIGRRSGVRLGPEHVARLRRQEFLGGHLRRVELGECLRYLAQPLRGVDDRPVEIDVDVVVARHMFHDLYSIASP